MQVRPDRGRPAGGRLAGGVAVGVAGAVVVWALGAAILAGGCAKRGMPPGGPEDRTAPVVNAISPARGEVGVDTRSEIRIVFSEPMKRRTVETAVVVSPPCRWLKRHWEEETYILVPADGLRADATYLVSVGAGAQDRHGVKMEETYVAGFATGQTIEAGVIAGRVYWKGLATEQAIVGVFDAAEAAGSSGFPGATPLYITLTGAGGRYEIPYVATGKTYRVIAFLDKNLNTEYDEDETVGCSGGETALGDSAAARGVDVALCDSDFRGSLKGTVTVIAAPDTSGAGANLKAAVLATSVADSASYSAVCDKQGGFSIGCVIPGQYVLEAFLDANGNQKRDADDTVGVWFPDTLTVRACEEATGVEITLGVGSQR